ncbi:MAG: sterol desaturase family protein [Patescibacteria group bacterium]
MYESLQNLLVEYLQQLSSGLISTMLILGIVYFVFWVLLAKPLRSRRIQLVKRAGLTQFRFEIINILLVILVNGFFTLLILRLRDGGYTKFYTDTGRFGFWYEILVVVILIVISDAWFYFVHRLLHTAKLYKFIHAEHHKSLDTTPFTSNSFHVLESILLTLWIIPTVMIMPTSLFSLGITQFLGLFNNIKSHLGYELYPKFFASVFPFNILATGTNHNLHHTRYNGNYGLFFRYWDIVFGTEFKDTQLIFKSINDRRNEEITILDNTQYQPLIVTKVIKETSDTVSIYFEPQDQKWYQYQAGQYLNIRIKLDGKWQYRCFSLSSSPTDKFLRITTKLNGAVTHYLYNNIVPGAVIESLLPVGEFILPSKEKGFNNYLFIAGGSGISPIYSMINYLIQNDPNSKITLFYANKSMDSTVFGYDLSLLIKNNPNQLNVKHFNKGVRFGLADLSTFIDSNSSFLTYACGPESLKTSIKQYFGQLNLDQSLLLTEDFVDGYVPWFGLM